MQAEFWNDRYGKSEYAYGVEPNEFLKRELIKLPTGSILFPAEGEGRNAVFAATLGWDVYAFDQSKEGQKKANSLAENNDVKLNYTIGTFGSLPYHKDQFDAIVLIYAHFPADKRKTFYNELVSYLKPGGLVILEGFSKENLSFVEKNPGIGGPRDLSMLFSTEEVASDFDDLEPLLLVEEVVELNEGLYHIGEGAVIRFIGRKK